MVMFYWSMAAGWDGDNMGKFIQAKDTRCQKRENLVDVIPLPMPYVVYIEPTNACNFKCAFCPTGDAELLRKVGRKTATMSLDLFKKVVDDIAASGTKLRLLSLYKDGEPLVNPDFPEMVRYAKNSGISDRIWTKSNGALLNPELNQRIVDAGLTWIGISVEAVSEQKYLEIAGVKIDYQKFRENIAHLYSIRKDLHIYIKIADSGLTEAEKQKFFDDFSPICDSYAIEKLMGWSYSSVKDFTLGTNPDTYDGLEFTAKDVCPYPFYVMAVNADGSVSLCGNDWSHATVVGNVKDRSMLEIWQGKALFEFRKMLLEGRRCENRACGDCYYLKIVPDNIDMHRNIIMQNLLESRND